MNDHQHHRLTPRQGDHSLGASPDGEFGRITRAAAHLFNVSLAQISLTDETRHRLFSRQDHVLSSSLPDLPFGDPHQTALLEVPDLTLHPDFAAHPLVAGSDAFRYYVTVPLLTLTGALLGTFYLLDTVPRAPLSPSQQAALLDLAGLVQDVLNRLQGQTEQTAELLKMASQDPLTGLPNRRAFEDAFEYAVSAGDPFGLMLLDLDELKQVNDTQGHAQGDHLLSSFAWALQDEFGAQGHIYRWGGDEFVVLRRGNAPALQSVRTQVNRVELQVRRRGLPGARVSIGMAEFPLDALAPNDLLRLADQRMLREKAARRAARGLSGHALDSQPTVWSGELLWQALRATSTLISADGVIDQAGWQAFLEAAVAALPGAEAGSLYVLEGTTFVLQAQVGYSVALLGAGRSPATMRRWHGSEGWQGGVARVLRGSTEIVARARGYEQLPRESTSLTIDDLCAVQQLLANLLVPVVVRGRVVAALNLDNLRSPQAFAPYEVRMAQEFARQAAAILAAHDRHAREAARTQELEVLVHASAALSAVQTPEEVEQILVAETRALLRTEHVVFARYEPDTHALRLVSPSGMYAQYSPGLLPHGQGVAWQAIQAQEVVHVPKMLNNERIYLGEGLIDGALMVAPLAPVADAPVGALAAVRAAPLTFSDLDGRLLGALASAGVTALERLQAAAQEWRRSQELQILAEFSEHVGRGNDSLSAAEECLGAARTFLKADLAVFVCGNRALTVTHGTVPASLADMSAEELEARLHGPSADDRAALCFATHCYPSAGEAHTALVEAGVQGLVKVPILERGQRVGVVALIWFRPLGVLPESAALLMTRSAELIGQVLDQEAHIKDLKGIREGALLTLGMALELRDFETAGHTERVVSLALRIAQRLGMEETALAELRVGAYLHDIGKLAVPDAILLKPGKLDAHEWGVMQRHSTIGDELVARIPTVTAQARSVVRHHHERWDGTGYPDRLAGTDIPVGARIFSVADVYDALTSERPYKAAWTSQEALSELISQAGHQFDPEIVRAAVEVLISPCHTVVLSC
ncbi:HD domain-containing phosphohydrolase [Deinococcus sp. QL22]|uniref:sensor domain-containing diguanylate cyclase/phosphohydrolase n=1 Tax=Deinococcus sp. QL22 TaxID=2939437 RepID=UPI00201714EB|nr:HD domain-containing phosphohydrolase [Deinococcus sp. QL22]UQN08404.1 diguanylate cyclase [Deinococcus sp. QL22]